MPHRTVRKATVTSAAVLQPRRRQRTPVRRAQRGQASIHPRSLRFFALLLVLTLGASFAVPRGTAGAGSNWYVSPSGNDANSGTSSFSPFKTIQKALQAALPGQTIILASGAYFQDVKSVRDGQAAAPIRITGPADAVIKGGGSARVVEINHDHIALEGFTIDGLHGSSSSASGYRDKLLYVMGKGNRDGVTGLKVLRMNLRNAGGECIRMKYFSSANEIAYNRITNCGAYDFKFAGGGKNGEGIYIGTAPEQLSKNPTPDLDQSRGNYIHDNVINTQGNEGVDIKEGATENVVEGNLVSGQKDPNSACLDARGDGNIFRRNAVSGCAGAGLRFGGDLYNGTPYGKNNSAYENSISNCAYGPVKVQVLPQGTLCGNVVSSCGSGTGSYGAGIDVSAPCGNVSIAGSGGSGGGGSVTSSQKLGIAATSAKSYDTRNGGYPPQNTLDVSLGTRWSGEGLGNWIKYDLGSPKNVASLNIAIYKGNNRIQKLEIEVSADGTNWTRVYQGSSSGKTLALEPYDFADVPARYVRIIGRGNTENNWNSLTEVEVYGF